MATITLYKDKINGVGSLLDDIIKSSNNLNAQLGTLKNTLQGVDSSTCNLQDTVDSISSSSKSEKEKVEDLKRLNSRLTEFIEMTTGRDASAKSEIERAKEDFYTKYKYLKPECEKSTWEHICDGLKSACEWCKEHWKLLVTIVIVAVSIVLLCTGVGAILAGACWGAIFGAVIGGVSGGLDSMARGGSFLDGFEDGAFSGAIGGAIGGAAFAGLGQLGAVAGNALNNFYKGAACISKVGKFIKGTAAVTKIMSIAMGSFDTIALLDKAFGNGDIAALNAKLHESKAYNIFQTGVTAVAVFTGGMTTTMKCFVAGTLIVTVTGLVAIENIKKGDVVISLNPQTREITSKLVLDVFSKTSNSLVHLTVNGEIIIATFDHPFYVRDKGFVNAVNLWIGAELIDSKGNGLIVDNIYKEHIEQKEIAVYNLNVQDFHTFFVGTSEILVHNLDCGRTTTAFDQEEFASTKEERIAQTPSKRNKNVEFKGERGNSKCVPKNQDSSLAKTLKDCGVDGIEYKNGVADLSPTSKGEVQIDYMLGGEGKMGTRARRWNFGQADEAMAKELNADPSAAKSLGLSPKNGSSFTASDVKAYRDSNGLTWHELNDTKTMQLIPTEVNAKFTHIGGVGEINAGAYAPGGFAAT